MGVPCCHSSSTVIAQQTWRFVFSIRLKRCRDTKLAMVMCYYNFWVWHLKDMFKVMLNGKKKMVSASKNTVFIYNPRKGPIKEREKNPMHFTQKHTLRIQAALYLQYPLFLFKNPSIQHKFKPGLYVPFVIILQFNQHQKVFCCVSGFNAYSWLLSGPFLRFSWSTWMENVYLISSFFSSRYFNGEFLSSSNNCSFITEQAYGRMEKL